MKPKQMLLLFIGSLLLLFSLSSCQSSKTLMIDPLTSESPKQSLIELTEEILPKPNTKEDPNWQKKINSSVYQGTVYDDNKFLVDIKLKAVYLTHVEEIIIERKNLDGKQMTYEQSQALCQQVYNNRFVKQYVEDTDEIYLFPHNGSSCIAVYASKDDIERYAKCRQVKSITSGDHHIEPYHPYEGETIVTVVPGIEPSLGE